MDDAAATHRMGSSTNRQVTVREAVIELMRGLGCTTLFGNPGSTELPMFRDWPKDFRYVLGLQESVVMGMADGYAQATHNAAFVNLHSAAGTGHALGNLFTAWKNNAPVVVIAGQQARSMLPMDPFLGAKDAADFPKPYVKFSIEPARAEDVPAAIARAYHVAMTEPMGPTFVSVPVDDWDKAADLVEPRRVVTRRRPDPEALAEVQRALEASKRPVIVVGSDIDRSGAFDGVVELAERWQAPVWTAPRVWRCGFPESHPLFAGFLPPLKAGVVEKLKSHDLVLVLGAPAFTYHNETKGPFLPDGSRLIQIVSDPDQAAYTPEGLSIVANLGAAVGDLLALPGPSVARAPAKGRGPRPKLEPRTPMSPRYLMQQLQALRPRDSIIVEEAPTTRDPMNDHMPIDKADGFLTTGSGGLGYGLPASVGVALGRPDQRVIALMGDGSAMYGFQALWTAAQMKLPMTVVIVNNAGYLALKHMGTLFQMQELVGVDLPGIDFVGLAKALGCEAARVDGPETLNATLEKALRSDRPFLVDVVVEPSF
jgi:benzoylformate decarboxylase